MNIDTTRTPVKRSNRGLALTATLILVSALGAGIYAGISTRLTDRKNLELATEHSAILNVSVVAPKGGAEAEEIQLPGSVMAFTEAPIYARTSGYIKRWFVDIGARVTQGQLLAEIETPELDQQLEQARADLEKADADLGQAKIKAERWANLLKNRAVSQEEADEATSDLAAKTAAVDSHRASVRRLERLQAFERIEAPFAGVITARNIDTGVLIDSGANTQPKELFHLAALDQVRVFVAVPEIYAEAARPGGKASLTFDEFPGRVFVGCLSRNASAIDMASRTLKLEVDVDNHDGSLLPGAYAIVHLKVGGEGSQRAASVTIPANTVLFRAEGPRVAVVRQGRAELTPIEIGRDYGKTLEIISGLKTTDQLVLDPSDSLTSGMQVSVSRDVASAK